MSCLKLNMLTSAPWEEALANVCVYHQKALKTAVGTQMGSVQTRCLFVHDAHKSRKHKKTTGPRSVPIRSCSTSGKIPGGNFWLSDASDSQTVHQIFIHTHIFISILLHLCGRPIGDRWVLWKLLMSGQRVQVFRNQGPVCNQTCYLFWRHSQLYLKPNTTEHWQKIPGTSLRNEDEISRQALCQRPQISRQPERSLLEQWQMAAFRFSSIVLYNTHTHTHTHTHMRARAECGGQRCVGTGNTHFRFLSDTIAAHPQPHPRFSVAAPSESADPGFDSRPYPNHWVSKRPNPHQTHWGQIKTTVMVGPRTHDMWLFSERVGLFRTLTHTHAHTLLYEYIPRCESLVQRVRYNSESPQDSRSRKGNIMLRQKFRSGSRRSVCAQIGSIKLCWFYSCFPP